MNSLGSRLTWWYVLVVTTTMALALGIGRWLVVQQMTRTIDLLNGVEFQEIKDRVQKGNAALPEPALLRAVSEHAELDAPLYLFQVQREPGREVLFRSPNMNDATLPPNPGGAPNWTCAAGSIGDVRASVFSVGRYGIVIATPLEKISKIMRGFWRISLIVLGIVVVISIFIGYWGSRVALDPIRRIQRTAERIGANNLSERVPVGPGRDEVADLARLLNRMFDRLEVSFMQLWRFAADASHELKTPLSLIRLQSEKLLLHGQLSPPQVEGVGQQLEEISRLNAVIEKLLFLARSGAGRIRPNLVPEETPRLLEAVAEDAEALCEEREIRFRLGEAAPLTAVFDSTLVRQVMLNLINNAVRATPRHGEIVLHSVAVNGVWRVAVEDTGPGIPEGKLSEIFEPFVRAEQEGADGKTGSGLGLTICRNIIDLHGGKIMAENRRGQPGLRVTFEIPLQPPSA